MLPENIAKKVALHEAQYGVSERGTLDTSEKGIDMSIGPRRPNQKSAKTSRKRSAYEPVNLKWAERRDAKTGEYRIIAG